MHSNIFLSVCTQLLHSCICAPYVCLYVFIHCNTNKLMQYREIIVKVGELHYVAIINKNYIHSLCLHSLLLSFVPSILVFFSRMTLERTFSRKK